MSETDAKLSMVIDVVAVYVAALDEWANTGLGAQEAALNRAERSLRGLVGDGQAPVAAGNSVMNVGELADARARIAQLEQERDEARRKVAFLDERRADDLSEFQSLKQGYRDIRDERDALRASNATLAVRLGEVCCKGEPHTCDQEAVAAAEGRTDRLLLAAQRLIDATRHCRSCRDCGDGPCCGNCDVQAATDAITSNAWRTK